MTNIWSDEPTVDVEITLDDHDLLIRENTLLREADSVVRSARLERGVVLLRASVGALAELAEGAAFAANHAIDGKRTARLDAALGAIEVAAPDFQLM